MLRELKRLMRKTGGGLRFVLLLILRSPVDMYMTAMQAVFLQHAFAAIGQNDAGRLGIVCLAFSAASLLIFLYNGTVWSIYAPFVVRMEGRLRKGLFRKIAGLPCERVEASPQGDWLTRLNTDVQMPFSQPLHLPHAVNAVVRIGVSSAMLWAISPAAFGWVMLFVLPQIMTSQLFIARAMPGLAKASLEATAVNTGDMRALIDCADIAAVYDGHAYLLSRIEQSSLTMLRVKMKMRKREAWNAALAIFPFGLGGYLVLLIVSSGWIAGGAFTFGDLTAVFQYRLGVQVGATMLINCLVSIQASMAGIRRINETMDEKAEEAYG